MTEQIQPHPYGFPDDWLYSEKIGELRTYSIQCFPPPNPKNMSEKHLKNFSLFQRLLLSVRDFTHAKSAATFIREDIDYEERYHLADLRRFTCYETTLIVSYCRPFSQSPEGIPPLSFEALGIKTSSFVSDLHANLIAKRNKIFAHSDPSAIDYSSPTVLRGNDCQGQPFTVLYLPHFKEGTFLTKAEIEQTSVLLDCTFGAVHNMIQAMHVNFLDQYPSYDMGLARSEFSQP